MKGIVVDCAGQTPYFSLKLLLNFASREELLQIAEAWVRIEQKAMERLLGKLKELGRPIPLWFGLESDYMYPRLSFQDVENTKQALSGILERIKMQKVCYIEGYPEGSLLEKIKAYIERCREERLFKKLEKERRKNREKIESEISELPVTPSVEDVLRFIEKD